MARSDCVSDITSIRDNRGGTRRRATTTVTYARTALTSRANQASSVHDTLFRRRSPSARQMSFGCQRTSRPPVSGNSLQLTGRLRVIAIAGDADAAVAVDTNAPLSGSANASRARKHSTWTSRSIHGASAMFLGAFSCPRSPPAKASGANDSPTVGRATTVGISLC